MKIYLLKPVLLLLLVLIVFMSHTSFAITVKQSVKNEQLNIKMTDINYPKSILDKELNSGLPNNISLHLSASVQGEKVFIFTLNHQITYDLWDEIYIIKTSTSEKSSHLEVIKTASELREFISNIGMLSSNALKQLEPNVTYEINAQILVNPVNSKRIEKIQNWIATSQGYTYNSNESQHNRAPLSNESRALKVGKIDNISNNSSENLNAARPRFQKLFDQILEQYMSSDEVPALWRSKIIKNDINIQNLLDEK
ncbi:hypothetical protein [Pseudoalteromonas denitrificans]|uniref:DUF4390 domain-containing protein n=1 Tax=Pseudoalteromonas denitrificans DSM 6059 TaxID=1123010 RepID=A0A1I1FR48_9GAMM|nr:hypothetical protein [Pseudoalteromonas denitrificans]SFC01486.1 hypothetical protein SAMN02745724_00723 [Pseudoalteromonas denitrificans DSM 6059]